MELEKQFFELKEKPKTIETANSLKTLLDETKAAKNTALYLDVLIYIIEIYKYNKLHQEAIDLLEELVNDDFLEKRESRLKIIDELISLLLRTEDFIKLKSVLFNRERFLTTDHQAIMQKFYLAVCYEGLEENDLAIKYLLEIPDTIANNILVSKYLKLSMLYLKNDDLNESRKMFDLATTFDKPHKNPIFHLVMSDIAYYEKDFGTAMNHYQEYFIKSKNKRRYLDRFILINIALNQLDEAWRFYQEYLPVMNQVVSKNYRKVFYKAAMQLAKKLGNTEELNKLTMMIESLTESDKPILNDFDNIYQILQVSFQNKIYYKERNIVYDVFKTLIGLYKYQKLLFFKLVDEKIYILYYNKGLLLEKNYSKEDYDDTLFSEITKFKNIHNVYDKEYLDKFGRSIYKNDETEYIFVNQIKRDETIKEFFLAYSDSLEHFDFQSKLFLLTAEVLSKLLSDFKQNINQQNLIRNYKKLFDNEKIGLIKIRNNSIHFLNEYAKKIFSEETEYLDYSIFQQHLIDKELYIDDLLKIDREVIKYNSDNKVKTLELSIVSDEFEIYANVRDISENMSDDRNNALNNSIFAEYPGEYSLINIEIDSEQKTLMGFEIRNYHDYFRDYSIEKYDMIIKEMIEFLKNQSRSHYNQIYILDVSKIVLLLDTVDKRVLNRITDAFTKKYSSDRLSLLDIRITGLFVKNKIDKEVLLKLNYLWSITNDENKYLFDNKNFRYNQELAKTILINVKNIILNKVLKFNYQIIGDWHDMSNKFLEVELANKAMLGDSSLKRVIKSSNLEIDWDLLVVKNLADDIRSSEVKNIFVLNMFTKVLLEEPNRRKMILGLAKSGLPLNNFILMFDMEELVKLEDIEILNKLKSKNLLIGATNATKYLTMEHYHVFDYIDYVYIDNKDIANPLFSKFSAFLSDVELILLHNNETLKKSTLEELGIKYINGPLFRKLNNLSELKK